MLEQSSSAFGGTTAAEKLFSFHTANLIIIIPCQLCSGTDSPADTKCVEVISADTHDTIYNIYTNIQTYIYYYISDALFSMLLYMANGIIIHKRYK